MDEQTRYWKDRALVCQSVLGVVAGMAATGLTQGNPEEWLRMLLRLAQNAHMQMDDLVMEKVIINELVELGDTIDDPRIMLNSLFPILGEAKITQIVNAFYGDKL